MDVTSPHYWFTIQKAFAFFLLTTIHRFKVYLTVLCSICLTNGNTKPLVAKWPCCFKDIFIYWMPRINCVEHSRGRILTSATYTRYIYIIVEKSPNSSHLYDHGFMDNTNCQAVCKSQKNPLSDSQTAEELHWKPWKHTTVNKKKTCYNIKCTYKYHFTSSV